MRRVAAVAGLALVLLSLALTATGCGGSRARETDASRRAKPVSPGTLASRGRADLDARDWLGTRTPALTELRSALVENPVFLNALSDQGNTTSVRGTLARIATTFTNAREGLSILQPSAVTEFRAADAKMVFAASLAARGLADYKSGLNQNVAAGVPLSDDAKALALLARGQASVRRAIAMLTSVQTYASSLDTQYATSR